MLNITMSGHHGTELTLSTYEKIQFYGLLFFEQVLGKTRFEGKIKVKRDLFFKTLAEKFKDLPDGKIKEIESYPEISIDIFKKIYFKKSKPVVFKGVAKNWACCQKWDLNYFRHLLGKKDVLLVDVDGLTTKESKKNFEVLSVEDLVANINAGGDKYLRFSPLVEQHTELSNDLNLNWLNSLKGRWSIGNTYYLFMGGKQTVTHLHCDQPCNLFVQIHGKKKWTLISVDQSHLLYPQATQTAYFKSSTDLGNLDEKEHPLLKKATRWETILDEGDVLYIPPHVWHHVENLTETIGLGFRFSSISAAVRSSFMFTFLRFCAQNPPMWKTRKYGKMDTNLIWADANGNISEVLKKINDRSSLS